ncbi:MAG TPA: hypothetical protein VI544_00965 [Candidatus Nanoarchaeia archaeon]|nr:hypothetical protein [Candidatus Nanoarchaeia archaeon]
MNKGAKNIILTLFGITYIALGLLSFYNAFKYTETAGILWFSYFAFFLIGIGILTRKSELIASQLNIILIPYIVWNIDFLYVFITGNSLWGITNYFLVQRPLIAQVITSQHIFTIPISLLAIYFIKIKNKGFWKFSLAQITIFYILIRALSTPEENINCVFSSCLPFQVPGAIYPVFWFSLYSVMIFLVTFSLNKIKVFQK